MNHSVPFSPVGLLCMSQTFMAQISLASHLALPWQLSKLLCPCRKLISGQPAIQIIYSPTPFLEKELLFYDSGPPECKSSYLAPLCHSIPLQYSYNLQWGRGLTRRSWKLHWKKGWSPFSLHTRAQSQSKSPIDLRTKLPAQIHNIHLIMWAGGTQWKM